MRFISDDGKVFNTIDECTEYENKIKRKHEEERRKKEEEIARRNELKKKQQERYESIQKHKKELLNEIYEYQKDYNSTALTHCNSYYMNYLDRLLILKLKYWQV